MANFLSRFRAFLGRGGGYTGRWLFLRALGCIYLIAFLSLAVQVDGLLGNEGILSASNFLAAVYEQVGWTAYYQVPSLAWMTHGSDLILYALIGLGATASVLIIVDRGLIVGLIGAWVAYLSLVSVGQVFLSYQWDLLLLEAGFLSIWAPFLPALVWLYRWLLFRLMFYSGSLKLLGSDSTWQNLTALRYHYETQPLPTPVAWYVHQLPMWVDTVSTALVLGIEMAAPLLLFTPRKLRRISAIPLAGLQIGIMLTGNYTFFNLLTLALVVFSLDDEWWEEWNVGWLLDRARRRLRRFERWRSIQVGSAVVGGVLLALSGLQFVQTYDFPITAAGEETLAAVRPFRLTGTYGLFVNMTTTRPEIVLQGSRDGEDWETYRFKYKPGDVNRGPQWVAPHQPRLDWQMWFASLRGHFRNTRWFQAFAYRLLTGSDAVERLLAHNPFPNKPPTYLRAILYRYRFSSWEAGTEAWWQRKQLRMYMPSISLQHFRTR